MSCTCDTYEIHVDGKVLIGERTRDPECEEHGYPDDRWRKNDPRRLHARKRGFPNYVRYDDSYDDETRVVRYQDIGAGMETPREVEERLIAEANGTWDRIRIERAGFPHPIRRPPMPRPFVKAAS